ncbi:MAG: hypothetical protein A4E71_02317 [Smithella sp. PtaU1.Bin162]|nr:MAG: hypothetical protein A4E71_02317 [Smithella sp. PtaU1.Bin162]
MLKVITDQTAIKKYARQFIRSFKPFVDEQIKVKLGHQGASFPAKVFWVKRLNIWFFSRATKDARYWNAFGIGKPQAGAMLPITCEINFPWSGIDRKTGGAFARDLSGNIFVIHRGKIGGGKKGIGKSLFEHNYRGNWTFAEDGDAVKQVAVIGMLNSPRFALQIANFVKKIELLKSTAVFSAQMEIDFPEVTFREDRVGNLPASEDLVSDAPCDRDLIISNLAAVLQRRKFKTGNDDKHELFLVDISKNKMSHIFAIPADSREKNILAATTKLLLQTAEAEGNPLPVLILPEEKTGTYAPLLQKIGITVLSFRLEAEKIIFPDPGKIRLDQNP